MTAKRHLWWGPQRLRGACGIPSPRRGTDDPAEVTCKACSRTLKMADAEVRSRIPAPKK